MRFLTAWVMALQVAALPRPDGYINDFASLIGWQIDLVWDNCTGYPGVAKQAEFFQYLQNNGVNDYSYCAYPQADDSEILRALDSIQLTSRYKVATPAQWEHGENVIILASVSDDDARKAFPDGWTAPRPSRSTRNSASGACATRPGPTAVGGSRCVIGRTRWTPSWRPRAGAIWAWPCCSMD